MKSVSWIVFGLVALLWTGGAFVTAELTQWAGQALASGDAASLGKEIAQWPVPPVLSVWVDPAIIQAAQSTVLWTVERLGEAMPMLGSTVGWLVPLIWIVWALGLVVMLVFAFGAQFLLGRLRPTRLRSA